MCGRKASFQNLVIVAQRLFAMHHSKKAVEEEPEEKEAPGHAKWQCMILDTTTYVKVSAPNNKCTAL